MAVQKNGRMAESNDRRSWMEVWKNGSLFLVKYGKMAVLAVLQGGKMEGWKLVDERMEVRS